LAKRKDSTVITAENIVESKGGEAYGVDLGATVRDAINIMIEHNIGSIVVRDGGKIVGIWTERDLTRNAATEGFDLSQAKIADHMISDLEFVPHTLSVFELMDHCLGVRHRRILVQKDGEFLGLLTSGDVMRACLTEKDEELKEVSAMANWKYYEDWGPSSSHKSEL
jgi:CBS domain-containing protein